MGEDYHLLEKWQVMSVNPNTMQKALTELERTGLVYKELVVDLLRRIVL